MLRSLRYQYLAIIWAAVVTVLCSLPADDLPDGSLFFEGFDKLAHTGFFFVLSVLLFYGKIRQQNSYEYRLLTIIKIFLIGAALGAFIEWLQCGAGGDGRLHPPRQAGRCCEDWRDGLRVLRQLFL